MNIRFFCPCWCSFLLAPFNHSSLFLQDYLYARLFLLLQEISSLTDIPIRPSVALWSCWRNLKWRNKIQDMFMILTFSRWPYSLMESFSLCDFQGIVLSILNGVTVTFQQPEQKSSVIQSSFLKVFWMCKDVRHRKTTKMSWKKYYSIVFGIWSKLVLFRWLKCLQ